MSSQAESVSSVVFARFTTSDPLPVAKIGSVVNHVHNLAFAQQVMSRVHGAGDIVNSYVYGCGYRDASGVQMRDASYNYITTSDTLSGTKKAIRLGFGSDINVGHNVGRVVDCSQAEQITWARSSADLSGVFQGRHCLQMQDFLNVWYQGGDDVAAKVSELTSAKLFDKHNNSGTGPIGWFGVDSGVTTSIQKKNGTDDWASETAKETMGVVLTDIGSSMRSNLGFNVQTQVMTNILSDLGVDVKSENESSGSVAADKLDSVSYLRLANYLGKHTDLAKIVEDSKVNSGDSMSRRQLFYELAKQYDVNNRVHDTQTSNKSARLIDLAKRNLPLTKEVKTDIDLGTDDGVTAAQKHLEIAFTDLTQYESGRVGIAFLYKSQTQGVRDTELVVHMKLSGGVVGGSGYTHALPGPGSYDAGANRHVTATVPVSDTSVPKRTVGDAKHLATDDRIGRTFKQMCTVHPMMVDGKPIGVTY
jgi:hypothetical protein